MCKKALPKLSALGDFCGYNRTDVINKCSAKMQSSTWANDFCLFPETHLRPQNNRARNRWQLII